MPTNQKGSFAGKVAFVTGAASGIGRAGRGGRLEQGVDAHRAGEPLGRPLGGRL